MTVTGEFLSRWLEIRAEAITRIAGEIRRAQAAGFCPGIDPVLTASALSAMLEHFCYVWLGQGRADRGPLRRRARHRHPRHHPGEVRLLAPGTL